MSTNPDRSVVPESHRESHAASEPTQPGATPTEPQTVTEPRTEPQPGDPWYIDPREPKAHPIDVIRDVQVRLAEDARRLDSATAIIREHWKRKPIEAEAARGAALRAEGLDELTECDLYGCDGQHLDIERLALAISASDGDRRTPSRRLMAEMIGQAKKVAAEYARLSRLPNERVGEDR